MDDLDLVKEDIDMVGILYKLLYSNKNYDAEVIRILKKSLIEYCKNILRVIDKEKETKDIKAADSLTKIIQMLINQNNRMSEVFYICIADIIKDTEDEDVKAKAIKCAVNIYNQMQNFNSEYIEEAERYNKIQAES